MFAIWVLDWFTDPANLELVYRLVAAMILGAVIGIERDVHGRAAGLRTHLLVSLGAALFTILSIEIIALYGDTGDYNRADPGRIAAQIVTGIGFLGAGTIIKSGFTVRGLTTASCLWLVAAIGMAAGAGMYMLAALTTMGGLFALIVLNIIEQVYPKDSYKRLIITLDNSADIATIIEVLDHQAVKILHITYDRDYDENRTEICFFLRIFNKGSADNLLQHLLLEFENSKIALHRISWKRE